MLRTTACIAIIVSCLKILADVPHQDTLVRRMTSEACVLGMLMSVLKLRMFRVQRGIICEAGCSLSPACRVDNKGTLLVKQLGCLRLLQRCRWACSRGA